MWFTNRFPEDLYRAVDSSKYNADVMNGYRIAREKTIAIVGLAHNCEKAIEHNIHRAITLGEFFDDSSIYIVENGSTDSTTSKLSSWGIKYKCVSTKRPTFNPVDPLRFQYMAYLRNEYMNYLKKICPDYVLVYDFDIQGGFSYDGVMHSLSQKKEAIGSNGLIYTPNRKFYDYISLIFPDKRKGDENVWYNRGERLVDVHSIFGGACLYEYAPMSELRYHGNDDGCEHTSINKYLDCYLNPSQIVLYSQNHYTL
jgi:hypothetical protein